LFRDTDCKMSEMDFARNPQIMLLSGGLSALAIGLQLWHRPSQATNKSDAVSPKVVHKIIMEGICVIVFFFCVSVALYVLSYDAISIRIATSIDYPRLSELSIAFLSFSILTIGRIITIPVGCYIARALTQGSVTEQKQQRFGAQFWKLIYHACATLTPVFILKKDAPWWPPGIGRSPETMFENYPYTPMIKELNIYYLVQLGWSLHSLFVTVFQTGRTDYVFVIIHHMATQTLVFGSYFVQNNLRLGTAVFFVHDICDFPVCLTRLFMYIGYAKCACGFYFLLLITWAVFRLILYPFSVIRNVSFSSFINGWIKWEDAYGWIPLTIALFILLALHIKWFIDFIRIGVDFFTKGVMTDTDELKKKTTEHNKTN